MKTKLIKYYHAVCKREKIAPLPIVFKSLRGGIACVEYNSRTMVPEKIIVDLNRCNDPEYALLHEVSHQILLLKKKDAAQRHNKAFRKLENDIIDKYMYSNITFKYLT